MFPVEQDQSTYLEWLRQMQLMFLVVVQLKKLYFAKPTMFPVSVIKPVLYLEEFKMLLTGCFIYMYNYK